MLTVTFLLFKDWLELVAGDSFDKAKLLFIFFLFFCRVIFD